MSPTQRCTAYLRARGYLVGSTERYVAAIRRRQDLFGIIDAIAIRGEQTIGVQFCGITGVDAHRDKIDAAETTALWRSGPRRLWVMAPFKPRAKRWRVRTWERWSQLSGEPLWIEISEQLDAEVLALALRAEVDCAAL